MSSAAVIPLQGRRQKRRRLGRMFVFIAHEDGTLSGVCDEKISYENDLSLFEGVLGRDKCI
jgi:hypothetical protein